MIEKLTQSEGTEILKISTEVASISTTSVAEESFHPGELPVDLPSTSLQPGKISEFGILTLGIAADIIVITTDDIALNQAKESITGTNAKDIPVEVSTERILIVEPVLKVATQEIIIVSNSKDPVVTSEMRQLSTHPASALL